MARKKGDNWRGAWAARKKTKDYRQRETGLIAKKVVKKKGRYVPVGLKGREVIKKKLVPIRRRK